MSSNIFISYRRDDSGPYAQSVAQYLEREFGAKNVFMDVGSLLGGQEFPTTLRSRLASSKVLIAIIGPTWAEIADSSGQQRLADPKDWVRLELALAMSLGVVIIPLLVNGAAMPKADALPMEIRPLVDRQAISLTASGFRHEMAGLAKDVRVWLDAPVWQFRRVALAAAVVGLVATIGLYIGHYPQRELAVTSRGLGLELDKVGITQCDLLAGEKLDHGFSGVIFDDIKSDVAIIGCRNELQKNPDHPRTTHNLGRAYDRSGDKATAADLYLRAARGGYTWAKNNLGVLLATGDGVPQDLDRAHAWILSASREGNEQAQKNLRDHDLTRLLPGEMKARIRRALKTLAIDVDETDSALRIAIEEYKRRKGIPGNGVNFLVLTEMSLIREAWQ